jgi:uncharacterized protein YuzE
VISVALIDSWDYDEEHDFIFFFGEDFDMSNYNYSLNCGDVVFDVNKMGLIHGIAVFNASTKIGIPKSAFRQIDYFNVNLNIISKDIIKMEIKSKLNFEPHKGEAYECNVKSTFVK